MHSANNSPTSMDGKKCSCCAPARLSACALALAFGATSALFILILGLVAWKFNYATEWVENLGHLYRGYAPTPKGVLIGTLWALVEGYIFGMLVGLIYNMWLKRCCCRQCYPKDTPAKM